MISKTIDIVVTSVLQTTAGKMIFGRYVESNTGQASATASPAAPSERTPEENGKTTRLRQTVT
jgi:hypothetical protein